MTKVRFTFVDIQGNPLPLLAFKLLVRRASFNDVDVGVTLPEELNVTTDVNGQVIIELWPLKTAYRIQVAEEYEELCGKLNWAFYVPKSTDIVEAQSLFMVPPPGSQPWDEEAMGKITQAVIDSHNSAVSADASADRTEAAAVTIEGDADRAEAAAMVALASKDSATASASTAVGAAADALASKNAAAVSQNAANNSAISASNDATLAGQRAAAALASQNAAASSATTATQQATAAGQAKTAAETAASTATTKAGEAASSASAAAGSASTANTKASESSASATAAKTSETNAKTSETNAATSASNASTAGAAAGTAAANAVVANKQDKHINLTAFAGLAGAADTLPYFTGAGALSLVTLTAKARGLLARTDAAGMQTELGLVPVSTTTDNTPGRVVTVGFNGLGGPLLNVQGTPSAVIARNAGATFSYMSASDKAPSMTADGALVTLGANIDYAFQIACDWRTGALYTQYKGGGALSGWLTQFNSVNSLIDPQLGGLMSMTTVSGFTVFKYLNGQMIVQGPVPTTPSIAANSQFTISVAIPVAFPAGNVSLVGTLYPSVGNDFAIRNTQAPGSTAYLFCANGASAQTFSGNIMLVGRWK